jgi:hypothetical protein
LIGLYKTTTEVRQDNGVTDVGQAQFWAAFFVGAGT